jgi:hypothetical protein
VGEPKQLTDDKADHYNFAWLTDSKSITYASAEPGHQPRSYLLEIQSGTVRPITPEGVVGSLVTPDGKFLLALDSKRVRWLYPVGGGEPQKFPFTPNPDERIMAFFDGGKSVLVRTPNLPVEITRVDLATGRRSPFKEIVPADPSGVQAIPTIRISADGKSYSYTVGRILSDLFVVDGLK